MKQTFKELIRKTNKVFYQDSPDSTGTAIDIDDVLELLNLVRKATLQEAANKVQHNHIIYDKTFIIDKDSILNLDLNSIEIDE